MAKAAKFLEDNPEMAKEIEAEIRNQLLSTLFAYSSIPSDQVSLSTAINQLN